MIATFLALLALVGGTPAGRRRLAAVSVVVGGVAFSGAAYSCGGCNVLEPPEAPSPTPTAPPTVPTPPAPTSTDPAPTDPPPVDPGPPEPPESRCVFEVPRVERAARPLPASRIVGGTPALPDEANWMVSLQSPGRSHFCGAALYRGAWVLTARHCMGIYSTMVAVVGRKDLRTFEGMEYQVSAADVRAPPQYDPKTFDWDVALIRLPEAPDVPPLGFYGGKLVDQRGDPVTADAWGWGRTSSGGAASPILLKVTIPIVMQAECMKTYALTPRMVCSDTVGFGSCQGDSGGPLTIEGWRVGVVSYGIGCADGWPGVYAYVGAALPPEATGLPGYSDDATRWVEDCAE